MLNAPLNELQKTTHELKGNHTGHRAGRTAAHPEEGGVVLNPSCAIFRTLLPPRKFNSRS